MSANDLKLCAAEFIGTFFMVFLGCGAAAMSQLPQWGLPGFAVPVVFGGAVAVMIYAVGHISGAHFNPAVSVAFALSRHFPLGKVAHYVLFQCLGAIAAAALLGWLLGRTGHDFGATRPALGLAPSFFTEMLLGFLLMFVIMAVATDTRAQGEMAGLAIGATVMLAAFVGGPLTGASMNPARSLGPALVSGQLEMLWIYLLAPVLGAALGAQAYQWVRCPRPGLDADGNPCC